MKKIWTILSATMKTLPTYAIHGFFVCSYYIRTERLIWSNERSSDCWDRIVPQFTQKEWKQNFRMNSMTFRYLCQRGSQGLWRSVGFSAVCRGYRWVSYSNSSPSQASNGLLQSKKFSFHYTPRCSRSSLLLHGHKCWLAWISPWCTCSGQLTIVQERCNRNFISLMTEENRGCICSSCACWRPCIPITAMDHQALLWHWQVI